MVPGLFLLMYQLYKQFTIIQTVPKISQHVEEQYVSTPSVVYSQPHMTPTNTIIPTIAPTIKPTVIPTATQTPTPTNTPVPPTSTNIPIQKPTSTPIKKLPANEFVDEVNRFRTLHGNQQIFSDTMLCTIAEQRVNYLNQRHTLDNHEGFQSYISEIKQYFSLWGEVIYYSEPSKSPHEVVFEGWANSQGHKDTVLQQEANAGCGASHSGFAVFIIGKHK
jgi:uncharacterized protein YkwD